MIPKRGTFVYPRRGGEWVVSLQLSDKLQFVVAQRQAKAHRTSDWAKTREVFYGVETFRNAK